MIPNFKKLNYMQKLNKKSDKNPYVKDPSEVQLALRNINWDFEPKSVVYEGVRPFNCRKHHWFPATFIPEIPFTLIELLTKPKATVYDLFSGIGSTYYQALSLSRMPYATEICQVAVEFIKSLFILFNSKLNLAQIQTEIKQMIDKYDPNIDYAERFKAESSTKTLIDKLKPWYHEETFNQLGFIFLAEHFCDDEATKAAISSCISTQMGEGMPQEQAIAMCHSEARSKTGKELKPRSTTLGK